MDVGDLPKDDDGSLLVDVYVHLPTQNRFIRWACVGDVLDNTKAEKLSKHIVPKAFIPLKFEPKTSFNVSPDSVDPNQIKVIKGDEPSLAPQMEKLSKENQAEMNLIFKSIVDPSLSPEETFRSVESAAEKILDMVAPETKELRAYILNNMKYLGLMNDVSAITSLSAMVAVASGFDSRKSLRDLAYACLIMDSSMSEFTADEVKQYYMDPAALPPEVLARFKKHPARSHELAQEKLKSLSDVTLQLILSHHELCNGKGFPRGLRTESVFALVKVLALGVDIFEVMKRAELNGKAKTIPETLLELTEPNVEAHLKRHNKKLMDSVLKFMNLEAPKPTKN